MKRIPNLMIGAMVITANSFADTTGRHPAYLHARTDLRRAERLMAVREDANVMRDRAPQPTKPAKLFMNWTRQLPGIGRTWVMIRP